VLLVAGCGAFSHQAQGAPKEEKKTTYLPTYLFLRFFEIFRSDFRKYFMVFLGSSCRETAKNAIKKKLWEKTTGKKNPQYFRPKVFDIDFSPKVFVVCGVFELTLLRNAQKRLLFFLIKKYQPTPFRSFSI
jgi:hypothetical protein